MVKYELNGVFFKKTKSISLYSPIYYLNIQNNLSFLIMRNYDENKED